MQGRIDVVVSIGITGNVVNFQGVVVKSQITLQMIQIEKIVGIRFIILHGGYPPFDQVMTLVYTNLQVFCKKNIFLK
jgi:hypothetical protein